MLCLPSSGIDLTREGDEIDVVEAHCFELALEHGEVVERRRQVGRAAEAGRLTVQPP
jgi:hypothetical protein